MHKKRFVNANTFLLLFLLYAYSMMRELNSFQRQSSRIMIPPPPRLSCEVIRLRSPTNTELVFALLSIGERKITIGRYTKCLLIAIFGDVIPVSGGCNSSSIKKKSTTFELPEIIAHLEWSWVLW